MINREEAFEMLVTVSDEWNQKQQQALNKIYNSIGNCGECKHWLNGFCKNLACTYNYHGKPNDMIETKSDFFCAGFERKP